MSSRHHRSSNQTFSYFNQLSGLIWYPSWVLFVWYCCFSFPIIVATCLCKYRLEASFYIIKHILRYEKIIFHAILYMKSISGGTKWLESLSPESQLSMWTVVLLFRTGDGTSVFETGRHASERGCVWNWGYPVCRRVQLCVPGKSSSVCGI